MTPRSVFVAIDLSGQTIPVGTLWPHVSRTRQAAAAATFEYDRTWLAHPASFALEPALSLGPGKFPTAAGRALFGAFGDSAPDRWGRTLMQRANAQRARAEGRAVPTLSEIDYLLSVDDALRQGALRFAIESGDPFLAPTSASSIPPLIELPTLLRATEEVLTDGADPSALRLLLAPGSSLGGTRPKASVRDNLGDLAIAKFPAPDDTHSVVLSEALALDLAQRAGLNVEAWRVAQVLDRSVLILRRFDRRGDQRVPFLSAMSMLTAADNEVHSYLEIADAIRRHGAAVGDDLRELWRRIVFTVLISNTDDHLRNHGFLYDESRRGWRLSPLYDVSPTPRSVKPPVLTMAIDETNTTASLDLAMEVAGYFDIRQDDARRMIGEMRTVVSQWTNRARMLGMAPGEIERLRSAFEPHEEA